MQHENTRLAAAVATAETLLDQSKAEASAAEARASTADKEYKAELKLRKEFEVKSKKATQEAQSAQAEARRLLAEAQKGATAATTQARDLAALGVVAKQLRRQLKRQHTRAQHCLDQQHRHLSQLVADLTKSLQLAGVRDQQVRSLSVLRVCLLECIARRIPCL